MNGITIAYDDFLRVDIRVGTVIKAEEFPEARKPALKVWIDFGSEVGVRKTSAQITGLYSIGQLKGLQVMGVVNLPAKQIGSFRSECLLLGFSDELGNIVLAGPQSIVTNGKRMH